MESRTHYTDAASCDAGAIRTMTHRAFTDRALLMGVLLAACSPPADVAHLTGTYVMTIGIDTLRLDSAGAYQRAFGSPSARAVDNGRWRLGNKNRLVVLTDLPQRWPDHGNHDVKRGWHSADT